jgi:hypothetical protein
MPAKPATSVVPARRQKSVRRIAAAFETGTALAAVSRPAGRSGFIEEYARWFPSAPPARYVTKLGVDLPGFLVSIRMTAFVG